MAGSYRDFFISFIVEMFRLVQIVAKIEDSFQNKTKQNKIRKSNLSTLRMPENPFLLDLYVYLEQMNYSKHQPYESFVITNATIFLNPLNRTKCEYAYTCAYCI